MAGQVEKLLDVPQVAEILGVGHWLAWRLVWDGRLRSTRVGRFVRVRPADLERFLDENSQASATASAIGGAAGVTRT